MPKRKQKRMPKRKQKRMPKRQQKKDAEEAAKQDALMAEPLQAESEKKYAVDTADEVAQPTRVQGSKRKITRAARARRR